MLEGPEPSGRIRLGLLGRFRLLTEAGTPVPVTNRRARALLGYLCFKGRDGETREQLSGLLWSDRQETQARASLRQCVLDLRSAMGAHGLDGLAVGRETIALDPETASYDVEELLSALAGSDSDEVTRLLGAAGRGQLLEDAEVPGLFWEWREIQRSWLADRIAAGVHRHIEKLESAGRWQSVKDLAEAYLHREPTDEPVVAAAMRADAALGSTTAAHRRFRILQAALERDYGAKPGGAAREALAEISRQASAPTAEPGPIAAAPVAARLDTQGPPLLLITAFDDQASEQKDLAISIREEVVLGLSRFRDLRVVTDARSLSEVQEDEASRSYLNYILGGRFRSSQAGARLTVQLLRASDRHVLWSEGLAVDTLSAEGMAIDMLIAKVVGAVLPTIEADVAHNATRAHADVYQRFVLARDAALSAASFAEAQAAAADLEALTEAEPRFVPAYLALARLYNTDYGYTLAGSTGDEERARALTLAKKALSADRAHVHGYTVAGWCYLRQRRWEPAKAHFEQAISLNPFYAGRVVEVGFGYVFLGELALARALIDRCLLLNPAPDDDMFADLGLLEMLRGDHERAASYFDLVANGHIWAHIHGAINATLDGGCSRDVARAALDRILAIWPPTKTAHSEAILEWIVYQHPFRDPEMARGFVDGARAMLTLAGAASPPALSAAP